jgi:hypothetical protein
MPGQTTNQKILERVLFQNSKSSVNNSDVKKKKNAIMQLK